VPSKTLRNLAIARILAGVANREHIVSSVHWSVPRVILVVVVYRIIVGAG